MPNKEEILRLVHSLIEKGTILPEDLYSIIQKAVFPPEPKKITQDLENWYKELGIESIIGHKFCLSPCPFTKEEIEVANRNNEIILCIPAGLTRQDLGKLFKLNCWALEDSLYPEGIYKEDFWFKTPMTFEPPYINESAKSIKRKFEDEGKLGFSLSRYLVFVSRVKYLTGKWPDYKWWTWLLAYRYDRSGYLIAGFDSEGKFSVHGWMPNFKAKFVGARYIMLPERG